MKRLGIFCFYDKYGIVNEYVEYLLLALKSVITYQIVVVNGVLQPESKELLLRISDKLLIRENKGFDAGAYKDVILDYLSKDELEEYDELILCNDSFYGPFFPFLDVWNKMEKYKSDFWGFTRHPGEIWEDGYAVSPHIQSYFLTIRKSLFMSNEFQVFWNKEVYYGSELIDAIKGFEIKFTTYFEKCGFIGMALTDISEYSHTQYNENPYMLYSYELIAQRLCPVLKRKSLLLINKYFKNAFKAYEYVCESTNYPGNLINDHIRRLNKQGDWCDGWDLEKLERFYTQHEKIYIYGAGLWGKRLLNYFEVRKWKVAGIFVSMGEKVVGSEQIFQPELLNETDGIVVALGKKNIQLLEEKLRELLTDQQLFIPNYK